MLIGVAVGETLRLVWSGDLVELGKAVELGDIVVSGVFVSCAAGDGECVGKGNGVGVGLCVGSCEIVGEGDGKGVGSANRNGVDVCDGVLVGVGALDGELVDVIIIPSTRGRAACDIFGRKAGVCVGGGVGEEVAARGVSVNSGTRAIKDLFSSSSNVSSNALTPKKSPGDSAIKQRTIHAMRRIFRVGLLV